MSAPASVVVGMLITRDGLYRQRCLVQPPPELIGPLTYRARAPRMENRFGRVDPLMLRSTQRAFVGLDLEHNPAETVGRIVHLERRQAGDVWAVGVAHGPMPSGALYFSPRVRSNEVEALVEHAALVRDPAQLSMPPVDVLAGDLEHVATTRMPDFMRQMLERARMAARRGRDVPVEVYDHDLERAEQRDALLLRADAGLVGLPARPPHSRVV